VFSLTELKARERPYAQASNLATTNVSRPPIVKYSRLCKGSYVTIQVKMIVPVPRCPPARQLRLRTTSLFVFVLSLAVSKPAPDSLCIRNCRMLLRNYRKQEPERDSICIDDLQSSHQKTLHSDRTVHRLAVDAEPLCPAVQQRFVRQTQNFCRETSLPRTATIAPRSQYDLITISQRTRSSS